MTIQATTTNPPARRMWRSTGAVLVGFLAVVVLSLTTDQALHMLDVYPPWGQPMREPGLCLLALSYRTVYAVVGSYIAAETRASQSNASRLGLGGSRARTELDRCDRHDPDGPGTSLVPHRARAHGPALCLAGRSSAPRNASRTIGNLCPSCVPGMKRNAASHSCAEPVNLAREDIRAESGIAREDTRAETA